MAGLAARVRRRRLLRVRHRPPAALQREGPGGQRPQALLPGQLAVLRPEHLRALPGADDDRAGRDARLEPRPRAPCCSSRCALGVLWAGLVLSLSQSSFAALLGGLAVLGVLRWKALPVLGAIAALAALAVAAVLLAPGSLEIDTRSTASLDKATSGRFDLVSGALSMARDRPVWGFGSGSFAERYRAREGVRSERVAAVSHTIPLTVAAEQGVIGLLAYLALMAAALRLVFAGVRARVRTRAARGSRRSRPPRWPRRSARSCCTPSCTRRSSRTPSPGRCWRWPGPWRARGARGLAAAPRAARRRLSGLLPWTGAFPQGDDRRCRRASLLGAAGAAAAYFLVLKKPGDISNPDVPFIDAEPTPGPKAKKAKPQKPSKFRWPRYGYTKDHRPQLRPGEADPRAVPRQVEAQGLGADRVPARDRPGPHPAALRRRAAGLARPRHAARSAGSASSAACRPPRRRSRTAAST